jgi:hypothetical protein
MAVPGALALRLRLSEELLMAVGAHISRWAALTAVAGEALTAVAGARISRWAALTAVAGEALTAVAEVEALTAVADPTAAVAAIMIELAGCRGFRTACSLLAKSDGRIVARRL